MRARILFACLLSTACLFGCASTNSILADIPTNPDVTTAAAPYASAGPLPAEAPPPPTPTGQSGHMPAYVGVRMSLVNFARDSQIGPTGKMDIYAFFEADPNLLLEATFGFTVPSADTDPDHWLSDGNFFMLPIVFGAYANLPLAVSYEGERDLVNLYIGGGLGFYLIDFDVSADAVHDAETMGWRYYDEWVDSTVGFHVGGGLNIFLNEQAAINVDLRYVMGMAQTHYQAYDIGSGLWWRDDDWVDIHHLQIGVGICVEF